MARRLILLRWFTVSIVALLLASSASGQVQGYPVEQPSNLHTIDRIDPSQVEFDLPPPEMGILDPFSPPLASQQFPSGGLLTFPPDSELNRVPAPVRTPCDDLFTCRTRRGSVITAFPRTLLWEPPLASPLEPRFQVMPTTLSTSSTKDTVDTAIGNTLGLLRLQPAGWATAVQVDFFGVVFSRFSQYNYLVDTDYRVGIPVTFALGPWQAKIGYEHTSTHLGDETLVRTGQQPFNFIKEELVMALGRYMWDQRWRVYGQMGWAVRQEVPGNPSPFRFAIGSELVGRRATDWWGTPFAATNLEFDGAVGYNPNFVLQLGWMWRDPSRRLSEGRIFGQYYTGHSPFGQFFQNREDWFGIGVAMDY